LKSFVTLSTDLFIPSDAHVDKAHNVQLPAIPIPACFHPPSQQWVAYYSDTAQRVQEDQATRKGFMAGPRYHQYLQLDGSNGELAGATDLATNGVTVGKSVLLRAIIDSTHEQ